MADASGAASGGTSFHQVSTTASNASSGADDKKKAALINKMRKGIRRKGVKRPRSAGSSTLSAATGRARKRYKLKRGNFQSLRTSQATAKRLTALRGGPKLAANETNLAKANAAQPHRTPFAYMKDRITSFVAGGNTETETSLTRWTDRIVDLNESRAQEWERVTSAEYNQMVGDGRDVEQIKTQVVAKLREQGQDVQTLRSDLLKLTKATPRNEGAIRLAAQALLNKLNSCFGNIPDVGPHFGINNRVSDNFHLNFPYGPSGPPSPGSKAALEMSDHEDFGVAANEDGDVIGTDGSIIPLENLDLAVLQKIQDHGLVKVDGTFLDWGSSYSGRKK